MTITRKKKFITEGYVSTPLFFDSIKIKKLCSKATKTRNFKNIFLSEKDYLKNELYTGVNPMPGRNLAEKLDTNFIFSNTDFRKELELVLGKSYRVLDYKFVVALPNKIIPKWIQNIIDNDPVANMGRFVMEKYRDMTYFRGIDFHQDIIDFPDRVSDFITVYIYLDKVTNNTSPLYILKKSHLLGASIFPHNLKKNNTNNFFEYTNDYGKKKLVKIAKLTGEAGTTHYWHPSLLHGTQPNNSQNDIRISMRILIEKNSAKLSNCLIDIVNKKIKGSLVLTKTRSDLTTSGKSKVKNNTINKFIK
jgi:hypothetical protein